MRERPELTYADRAAPDAGDAGKGLWSATRASVARVRRRTRAGRAADQPAGRTDRQGFAGSGKALVLAALNEHVTDKERDEIKRFLKESSNG